MDFKYRLTTAFSLLIMVFSLQADAAKVASVNGRAITDEDVKRALDGFNNTQQDNILGNQLAKGQVVDTLIAQELLIQEAEKEKLQDTKEFQNALENFKKQALAMMVVKKKLEPRLTEKAAKAFYNKNKFFYSTEQVRAHHILVDTEKQAEQLLKQAKKKGVDFQKLAEKYSKDPSAKNNRGDIGYFTRDRMAPEFTNVAFRTEVGEVAGPVKTSFGYHVIKVVDRIPGAPLEYEEVELRVKTALRNELVERYVEKLRTGAKVQVAKASGK